VNVTAPRPVRNAEFTRALGSVLHRPTILPVPAPVLRLLLGQMAEELLLSGVAVQPKRAEAAGHAFVHPRIEGALAAALGKEGRD
jgi:NAD dependent epimerase/dehydratase family enzyme